MQRKSKRALIAVGIGGSFVAFVALIVYLSRSELVSVEMAKLMLAALLGLYVGFGFLILVYLFTRKLK